MGCHKFNSKMGCHNSTSVLHRNSPQPLAVGPLVAPPPQSSLCTETKRFRKTHLTYTKDSHGYGDNTCTTLYNHMFSHKVHGSSMACPP